ncbi:MAG: hypothetical protein PHX43_01690 [Alphaproteobacteria bacterium]|nr:hypothetical protein [Alphaproteobacteria bacterium]
MDSAELSAAYGNHVAQRLRNELMPTELTLLSVKDLPDYLETCADTFHRIYNEALNSAELSDHEMAKLRLCWQQTEDLAYIVRVAEDATVSAHRSLGNV